ncbi:MAG: hypothetical protein JWQ25_1534, partial [Daejeonella sp.]|nr:hypothetical protein [Daejeonella sp.]
FEQTIHGEPSNYEIMLKIEKLYYYS